jgi:hypothetical protein
MEAVAPDVTAFDFEVWLTAAYVFEDWYFTAYLAVEELEFNSTQAIDDVGISQE